MTKNIAQKYQVLDEIEHVRLRTGMYAGSVEAAASDEWTYDAGSPPRMLRRRVTYSPALVKIFSEILDNAIDEAKRAPEVLDVIRVELGEDGVISVADNGRGIPVEIHPQTGKYVAETIFTNLRAGSNFDDSQDRTLIGTNGVGSTLTAILSTKFRIDSCDGKKRLRQDLSDGLKVIGEPRITPDSKRGTKITFTPDYAFFKLPGLDADHRDKMAKRVVDAAACNPGVKFYLNGERVQVKDWGDYVALYDADYVIDETPDWKVAITAAPEFEQVSFVNAVETYKGGTHVGYVMDQVVERVRAHMAKKYKVDVKPGDVRAHMRVYISATINQPRFSSQTKENLVSTVSTYGTSWEVPDRFIAKLLKSSIVQSILDWVEAKAKAAELAELRKLNKAAAKTDPKRVEKFSDAVEKHNRSACELYLCEGDSARLSIQSARGKNTLIGSFSLRGKPLSVYDADTKEVIANREFANILAATGLQLGEPVNSVTQLRFGKIVILSDADLDGWHINALMMAFFAKFWPELFDLGVIYRMVTPLVIATMKRGGEVKEFFSDEEYEAWAARAPAHTADRYKGLGGFDTDTFKRFLAERERYLVRVSRLEAADRERLQLAFSGDLADSRKQWLEEVRYFQDLE